MYKIGQNIIYGNVGVCCVRSVVTGQKIGLEAGQYYMLEPLYENGTIYTPVDTTRVFMRPVISKVEADALIDQIPQIEEIPDNTKNIQELRSHYKQVTEQHDCAGLIGLTMSIHAKEVEKKRCGHKLGQIDEKYLKQAESTLCREFSVALEIPTQEVPRYIKARLARRSV